MTGLVVDVDAMRRLGSGVTRTATQLADEIPLAPALAVTAPGWAAGATVVRLVERTIDGMGRLAGRIGETGGRLAVAADGYTAADERAARRLHSRAA